MSNKEKILARIRKHEHQSIKQLADALGISLSMTHRHVRDLCDAKKITKIGSAPRVFYILSDSTELSLQHIDEKYKKIIAQNFLYISPQGRRTDGYHGFVLWCDKRGFDVVQKAKEYYALHQKYEKMKKNGVLSGKKKLIDTFHQDVCLADVFYADFYAWEIFGKTKLGQLLLFAKQSQDKKIMKEVANIIRPHIEQICVEKKITAIGFIPPTVKRHIQFMHVLKEFLALSLPEIAIVKVHADIITPQKTLSKLNDRVENAKNTFVVTEQKTYKNVLLIDDAIGSGATLNHVACKLLRKKVAQNVYGFAITGSVKGFDVISEV